MDYRYQRRGYRGIFSSPLYNFQQLDSTFKTFHRFVELHYLHEFNGSIVNKIPFLKILKLTERVGANFLYAPERRNMFYYEGFVGIDKAIRLGRDRWKIGYYFTAGYSNLFENPGLIQNQHPRIRSLQQRLAVIVCLVLVFNVMAVKSGRFKSRLRVHSSWTSADQATLYIDSAANDNKTSLTTAGYKTHASKKAVYLGEEIINIPNLATGPVQLNNSIVDLYFVGVSFRIQPN